MNPLHQCHLVKVPTMTELNVERFLKDVEHHEMTIMLDDGVFRSIRFAKPNDSNLHFTLTTWNGYLGYTGDMGCFVFSRMSDMFEFFRPRNPESPLRINPGYWSEKIQATDWRGGHEEYSREAFTAELEEQVQSFLKDNEDEIATIERLANGKKVEAELRESIQSEILYDFEDFQDVQDVQRAIQNCCQFCFDASELLDRKTRSGLSFDGPKFCPSDFWENNCQVHTFRFLWCCYAIVWGIQKYDAYKRSLQTQGISI
jgi:hypothetical protein